MKCVVGLVTLSLVVVACGSDAPSTERCTVSQNDDGTATIICPDGTQVTVGPDASGDVSDTDSAIGDVADDQPDERDVPGPEDLADELTPDEDAEVSDEDAASDPDIDDPEDVLDLDDEADTADRVDTSPDEDITPDSDTEVGADVEPPSVRFVHPVDGQSVGVEVNVVIEASDDQALELVALSLGGESLVTWDEPPFEYVWDTSELVAGSYDLVARGFDEAGNESEARARVWVIGTCTDDGDCPPNYLRITRPVYDAVVCGDITVEATARDDDAIDRIEFQIDGTTVGEATDPPYRLEWDTTRHSDGRHSIEVLAYDTEEQKAFASMPVEVLNEGERCDNQPNVWITTPEDSDYVTGVVDVRAEVWDDVGVVDVGFFGNHGLIERDSSAPYDIDWATDGLDEGPHILEAWATDTAEQEAVSRISVTVDRTPPDVELTSPRDDTFYGDSVPFSATVSDNFALYRLEFRVNGTSEAPDGVFDAEPWEATYDTTAVPSGWHEARATAYDLAGNQADDVVDFLLDRPPTVSFQAPSASATITGPFTVQINTSDDRGIASAGLFVDGTQVGSFSGNTFDWTPEYRAGARTLRAVVTDLVSQTHESSISVTVNHPLEVELLRCVEGSCAGLVPGEATGTVAIETTALDDDGTITRVEYSVGGVLAYTASTAPWRFDWDTTGSADGDVVLAATAFNDNGSQESDSETMTVNNCDKDHDTFVEESDLCGGDDCNDRNNQIHPNADDVCDGEDNDCSDTADDSTNDVLGCRADEVCLGAVCRCPVDQLECDGICRATTWFVDNDDHCGVCDTACTEALSECVVDDCVVCPGEAACDGACREAVWFESNDEHCGECGTACTETLSECVVDDCVVCPGAEACDGACRDSDWFVGNDDHCGECLNGCESGETCDADECVCSDGHKICDGTCIDTVRDPLHCGTCDHECPVETPFCVDGGCMGPPPEGFVYISPGTFTMGSPLDELGGERDEIQHEVALTRPFVLQDHEVTRLEWRNLMGTDPSFLRACGDECPVEYVFWSNALEYCNALSTEEGLPECFSLTGCHGEGVDMYCTEATVLAPDGDPYQCEGYRLPTEAEWEFAYRAGTSTAFYNGGISITGVGNDPALQAIAWYTWNSKTTAYPGGSPRPVRTRIPNEWGLYDMSGNVWEWTWDRYGNYALEDVTDPLGAESGSVVLRGGWWNGYVEKCRAAERSSTGTNQRSGTIGFRPARTIFP